MSIKVELYNLVKETLQNIKVLGDPIFKYVGHYNGQELQNPNNFAYKTPAVFIGLNRINWTHTKHDTPENDQTREQDGMIQFSLHYFLHDLRTDSDSFTDHLEIIDLSYQSLIGLRSGSDIKGKISSLRRIREFDDSNNNNLRNWIAFYETRLQEPGVKAGKVDAQPVELVLNILPLGGLKFIAVADPQIGLDPPVLAYNNINKITTNG